MPLHYEAQMDFEIPRTLFGEEHEIFRDTVARFLKDEVLPHYDDWEIAGRTPPEIWRRRGRFLLELPWKR